MVEYVLWLIITVGTQTLHQPLESYPTMLNCQAALSQVGLAMRDAYPGEKDWKLQCLEHNPAMPVK